MVSPNDFQYGFTYKYVRFNDGSIVFDEVDSNHKWMADCFPELVPVSAGRIKVGDKIFMMDDYGSFTLGLKADFSDLDIMTEFLAGFGYVQEYVY